ncbi:ABC-type dipeptide/oligopeptide/nickel transport system permease component [Microbacterium resistens]|uniref:ABC-type dipeptide/oligopeptide/nickel transport system permease component n=1 Tax=Microbacterium resistens TaxID=156977 RepID=A0ABU1SAD9_9MICO|nr:ABC transporter permease [Microbacterium resistens]MDR6866223.1 ABC-type dipeptide/oligopeptide/nickel transport system permease component [Microbacterium resistens]
MLRYLVSRVVMLLVQVFLVLTLVFVLFRVAPGDPAALILGPNATGEQVELLRTRMGLNDPILMQYLNYLGGLIVGDFGQSTSYSAPVMQVVFGRIPATLALLGCSLLLAVGVGVSAGVFSAVRPASLFSKGTLLLWVLLLAVPNFWLGMILIQLFAVQLGWLPAIGSAGLAGLVLPAVAVAARLVALIARLTRATMLETLGEDCMRTAAARGVSPARMVLVHALKPAAPAILTMVGLQAGYLLGGAVVVENLFSYPGMGQLLLASVSQRDYTLMQGITIVFVCGFLLINLVVDLVSSRIDPRVRILGGAR